MSYHVIGIPKVGNAMGYASGGGNAAAPGGDGSGLTPEQAKKLAGLPGTEQFGMVGRYSGVNGGFAANEAYRSSGFMILNPNVGLKYNVTVGGGVAAVAFFDSDRQFISAITAGGQEEIDTADFPENAVFFTCSTTAASLDSAFYDNGDTIESREVAVSGALAGKLDKSVYQSEHAQFGLVGLWRKDTLMFVQNTDYRSSEIILVNRNYPIKVIGSGTSGAAALIFFDVNGKAFSAYNYEDTSGKASSFEILPEDIPASAVYFACSSGIGRTASYTNGETIEAREGAVCDAIRASKIALLADEWNVMWGTYGKYDPANAPDAAHPFMGNDIWMTYEEALDIKAVWSNNVIAEGCGAYLFMKCQNSPLVRTLPPLPIYNADLSWLLSGQTKLEVVRLGFYGSFAAKASATNISYILNNCTSLREVRGELALSAKVPAGMLISATDIPVEEFKITAISYNINLGHLPKLSLASMRHMVTNAANTSAIIITVHADVYAKLTGDTTNEAAATLSEEELAAWGQVLTDAAARNISFACA